MSDSLDVSIHAPVWVRQRKFYFFASFFYIDVAKFPLPSLIRQ